MKYSLRMKKLALTLGSAAVLSAGFVTSADAVPIVGRFNMTFGTVVVTLGNVDWTPVNTPPNGTETTGTFEMIPTLATRSGVFLDPVFNALPNPGTIEDISANPADANYMPLGPQVPEDRDFLTLGEKPTWRFIATSLASGTFPSSPYILTEQGGNVSATISISGIACDSTDNDCNDVSDGQVSKWTAIISAQYTNTTILALQTILLAGGALPENTWSGTFEASVPEPGTLALLGIAAIGLAGFGRRSGKQAA